MKGGHFNTNMMSKILKIAVIVTLGSLLIMAPGCSKKVVAPWQTFELSSIAASPYRVNIPVNGPSNITINDIFSKISSGNITSASGGLKVVTSNVTFKSSNEAIVAVNGSGLARGISAGSANISVSYTDHNITKTTDIPVTITAPPGT